MRIVILVLISTMLMAAIPPLSARYESRYELKSNADKHVDKPKESKKKCFVRKKRQSNRCHSHKQHKATQSIDKLR